MAWIFKVVKQAPGGTDPVTEYVGSGISDEESAKDHILRGFNSGEGQIFTVAKVTDAELSEYGVPVGRTQVIQYSGKLHGHMDQIATQKQTVAEAFLAEWMADNAVPTEDDTVSTPRSLASKCYAEATNRGVDADALSKAAGGDLEAFITKGLSRRESA